MSLAQFAHTPEEELPSPEISSLPTGSGFGSRTGFLFIASADELRVDDDFVLLEVVR